MVWFGSFKRDVRFYRTSGIRLYVVISIEAQRSVINRMNLLDDDIGASTDAAEVPRSISFRHVNHEFYF